MNLLGKYPQNGQGFKWYNLNIWVNRAITSYTPNFSTYLKLKTSTLDNLDSVWCLLQIFYVILHKHAWVPDIFL